MNIDGHECTLGDNGTLDTVICIDGTEHSLSGEYAAEFRDPDGSLTVRGFASLCRDLIEDGLL